MSKFNKIMAWIIILTTWVSIMSITGIGMYFFFKLAF